MEEKTPTPKIYAAITAIMQELDPIKKEQKNSGQGFNYRGIDQLYNALNPLFTKFKVICVPKTLERIEKEFETEKGKTWRHVSVHIEYTLFAEDGSFIKGDTWGDGDDAGDKATNKANSGAQKYFFFQTFVIPTDDIADPDKSSHEGAVTDKKKTTPTTPATGTPATPAAAATGPASPKNPVPPDVQKLQNLPQDIQDAFRQKKYFQKQCIEFCVLHKWDPEKMRDTLKNNTPGMKSPAPALAAPVATPAAAAKDSTDPLTPGEVAFQEFWDTIESSDMVHFDFIQKNVNNNKFMNDEQKLKLSTFITERRKKSFAGKR